MIRNGSEVMFTLFIEDSPLTVSSSIAPLVNVAVEIFDNRVWHIKNMQTGDIVATSGGKTDGV